MKYFAHRFILTAVFFGIVGISCNKPEADAVPPTIELISEGGLVFSDTSAQVASSIHFKVHCKWNGENTLTNFIVLNNGIRVVDDGMNTREFEKNVELVKGSKDVDSVKFTIRDIRGASSSISLNIFKESGSGGGDLIRINNINLNAQSSPLGKSFLSTSDGITYTLQEAHGTQENIDLLYYYDNITADANTIASPGANLDASIFTGTFGLSNWTTKNTARFIKINLSQQQFDTIVDPIFVVNSYNAIGNRKAKTLVAGDVYSFKLENSGKYGILKISEVQGQEYGSVGLSIVMQK